KILEEAIVANLLRLRDNETSLTQPPRTSVRSDFRYCIPSGNCYKPVYPKYNDCKLRSLSKDLGSSRRLLHPPKSRSRKCFKVPMEFGKAVKGDFLNSNARRYLKLERHRFISDS
ncbi:hypothetical protein ES332_D13G247800v1, partial [Gossypium tomentosum]